MEYSSNEIIVATGPLAGRRFAVPADGGLRLGRSSLCEISIPDPALSRSHCLFELRNGGVWVTDLASANGTRVNDAPLGPSSRRLEVGDVVSAGDTTLQIAGDETANETPTLMLRTQDGSTAASTSDGELDLGLGDKAKDKGDSASPQGKSLGRGVLWGAAGAVALVAASFILLAPEPEAPPPAVAVIKNATDETLIAASYEYVSASTAKIYRYFMEYRGDGTLHVEYDDVPGENRHLSRNVKLSEAARKNLADLFSGEALYSLDPEYSGVGVSAGVLESRRLRVVRGSRVFETSVENKEPPDALRSVCERLEAFSRNELGTWALQYSSEKLQALSAESARLGDAKWNERDVQYGNLAESIKAYDEAITYLDTVNPKPASYESLVARRKAAKEELDSRYSNQRFIVDRAMNMQDWSAARRELRILCDMVPDDRDPRHAEATAKLLDVETRQKKRGAK